MQTRVDSVIHRDEQRGLWALVSGALALGFSPILMRLSEFGPTASAFYRPLLALPVLWLWMWYERRHASVKTLQKRDHCILFLAGAFFAGDLAFWHWSVNFTSVANATLFATSTPIWVALAGWLLFRESVSRLFLFGMSLSLLGGAILMGTSLALDLRHLIGDGLGLITALFLTGYILTVKRLRSACSTAQIMFWSSFWTAVCLFPLALLSGETLGFISWYAWLIVLALGLVAHVAGQGLFAYALAHLPAGFSSVGLLLEAVSAAVLGWLLLGEALSGWQLVGGFIVLTGIVVARRGS